jgi:YD repeat-containing protein
VLTGAWAQTTLTRTSAFEYDATTGAILREIIEPDNSDLCLVTAYTYDAYGNRTGATTRNCNGTSTGGVTEAPAPVGNAVFTSRTATTLFQAGSVTIDGTVYNYPAGQFPTTATNALNQSETRTFDPRFGGALSVTGPNALTTSWTYDKFSRKASESRADGTSTTWTYSFCGTAPSYCGHSVTVASTGAPTSTTHHDRLNRAWRKEVQGFDGTLVRTDTQFDALGRVYRTSQPYYATGTPVWTTFTYDVLGRPSSQTNAIGGVTSKSYNGLTTTTTNPLGQVETQLKNSQGQITQVSRQ